MWSGPGNQEATNPVDAMAQSYTPAQFPPPPQNGIPGEFAAPHALPTQDFTGQNRVPEHTLTLYTPTQTHSDPTTNDSSRPTINTNTNSAPSNLYNLTVDLRSDCRWSNAVCLCAKTLVQNKLMQIPSIPV
ncbi:hypothetical protein NFI96_003125 [Prochilodus magdalenae]|nr:hypothetical protein NFI96_003125 [Prochilodus magdalenae]